MVFHARLGEDGRKFKFQIIELFAKAPLCKGGCLFA